MQRTWKLGSLAVVLAVSSSVASPAQAQDVPAIVKLQTIPDRLTLSDVRDARSVLVIGQTADGKSVDLSETATRTAGGPQIAGSLVPIDGLS